MIQDVDGIARKTYQRGLGVGFTDSFEMHRRLSLEAEKGWLRGYVLYVQNAPSAFWIGTLYLGTFHSDYMGYDPALGKYSPGMFLAVKVIEELCNGSDSGGQIYKIDFGLGDAQYKEVLGDSEWSDASLYIFPCSFKGIGLNVVRTSAAILERVARRALEESGLLGKVKKMWRLRTTPTG
jgi:CelD/BcsL family acetyltransferase involved in cellulose biosynthesis